MAALHSATLLEQLTALKQGQITSQELGQDTLRYLKAVNQRLNYVVTLTHPDSANLQGPLGGIPYALKDIFSTRGIKTTASSHILSDYVPVFDSTVYTKLKTAGAVMVAKSNLDELAMGGTGMNTAQGPALNPYDPLRMTGGSSGGSAGLVASGVVPFAIGSDTGDSVRKPAAFCGIVGMKPTWGAISRYGLFPFAPSLDHVGYFTRSVEDAAYLFDILAGYDTKDATSAKRTYVPTFPLSGDLKGRRIAVIRPIVESVSNPLVKQAFDDVTLQLKAAGATVDYVDFDLDLLKAVLPTYMVISSSEATSNDANLDGVKFGPRGQGLTIDEVILSTRTEGFSELVKRRFVLGSYCLSKEHKDKLFLRAQKVRRLMVERQLEILAQYDVYMAPASGDVAPTLKSTNNEKLSNQYLIAENYLALGNFSGLPSITIPSGFVNGLPIGINLTGRAFDEKTVFEIAFGMEQRLGLKNRSARVDS